MVNKRLCEYLKECRLKSGVKQSEIAQNLGIVSVAICMMEKGAIAATPEKIAQYIRHCKADLSRVRIVESNHFNDQIKSELSKIKKQKRSA